MASSSSSSDQSLSIKPDQTTTLSMLSRTSSSSSDYIGTESCFDVISANLENKATSVVERRKDQKEVITTAAREFPPPIPLLAQTENLLPHMPWVLKREVTRDGRLILREEKVRHHEYFRANRSNGRLTLHLVPLEDDVFELPQEPSHYQTHNNDDDDDDDEHGVIITVPDDEYKDNVNGDSQDEYGKVLSEAAVEETVMENGVMVGGGGGSPRGKCLKSCFVGMRVREIRPVLS